MKKQIISGVAVLLIAVISALAIPSIYARADAIAEPNNDFHRRNRTNCVSLNRNFYANGKIGSVSVKNEPGSKREVTEIENGEVLYILATYNHNGEIWGIIDMYVPDKLDDPWLNGWVPMDDLLLVYDYISFEEDYGFEFCDYDGDEAALREIAEVLLAADEIVLWSWPGSGVYHNVLGEPYKERSFDFYFSPDPLRFRFVLLPHAYTDSDGREWVFISEVMKYHGNSWVCLSDPSNPNIPAFNPAPEPELWQPGELNLEKPGGLPTPVLIIILVAAIVIVTAVLIRIFWKKKTDGPV
jgi:hypothetical protein